MGRDVLNDLALNILLAAQTSTATSPPSSNIQPYVLALIAAAGLVLAPTLPVLLSRSKPKKRVHPLNSDGLDDEEEEELRDLRKKTRAYEIFLWRRRYDPNRIKTGEESPDDVRFR